MVIMMFEVKRLRGLFVLYWCAAFLRWGALHQIILWTWSPLLRTCLASPVLSSVLSSPKANSKRPFLSACFPQLPQVLVGYGLLVMPSVPACALKRNVDRWTIATPRKRGQKRRGRGNKWWENSIGMRGTYNSSSNKGLGMTISSGTVTECTSVTCPGALKSVVLEILYQVLFFRTLSFFFLLNPLRVFYTVT